MSRRQRNLATFVAVAIVVTLVSLPLVGPAFDTQIERRVQQHSTVLATGIEQAIAANVAAAFGVGTTLPAALPAISLDEYGARFAPLVAAGMLDEVAAVALVQDIEADELDARLAAMDASVRRELQLRLGPGPRHLLVTHTTPFEPNRITLGVDVTSIDGLRATVVAAADDGVIAMSPPVTLVQETEDQLGSVIYLPLPTATFVVDGTGAADAATPAEPGGAVLGVVVRHQALFDRIRPPLPGIRDEVIHLDTGLVVATAGAPASGRSFAGEHEFALYGQRWLVRSEGDSRTRTSIGRTAPWTLPLLLGIVAALTFSLVVNRRSTRIANALVAERTAELRGAESRLQQAVDELEVANRVKDEVLAAVSHDLRTPLTVIGGLAQTLEARPGDEELTRQAVGRISHQVSRLETLIRDLITTGTGHDPDHARREVLDLVALARQVTDDLDIGSVVSDLDVVEVAAVPTDIERILNNLLTNAARHGAAPIEVEIAGVSGADEPPGDDTSAAMVQLAVRDHGPGIEPAHQAGVFDPFQQVGRRSSGGIGLGLTIALRLARGNGGHLHYEPAEGGGARFVLRLPAAHSSDTSTRTTTTDASAACDATPPRQDPGHAR